VEEVVFVEKLVTFKVPSINGYFVGRFDVEGKSLTGKWVQNGVSMPLNLERKSEVPMPNRPQEPKVPYPYESENITYPNTVDNISLAGTLTYPRKGGPFPAVILISGSRAQDRNEALMFHRPFLILSDHLTRNGIAVLRYDDRGFGRSTGSFISATSEDLARDVSAGIEYLKTRNEIDPGKIGLAGHSEGGIIAPMVAIQSKDVAFVILMAGTGVTGEELLYLQSELISKLENIPEPAIEKYRKMQSDLFGLLKSEKDETALKEKLTKVFENHIAGLTLEERKILMLTESTIPLHVQSFMTPWLRFFIFYDPAPVLQKVKCPVLAINGDKDVQVPVNQNLPAIEKALKTGGNTNYKIVPLPGLNHLFQTAETGSPGEYGKIEETISPVALETMSSWVKEIVGD